MSSVDENVEPVDEATAAAEFWQSWEELKCGRQLDSMELHGLQRRVDALERHRFRWRNRWLRFARTRIGDFLVWNPVLKWSVRMLPSRTGREREILPLLNGKDCAKHYLFEPGGLLSVCGFGFLWGVELECGEPGKVKYKIKKDRAEGESFIIRGWRFGRISITHHNK